jgi:hypothetical protein
MKAAPRAPAQAAAGARSEMSGHVCMCRRYPGPVALGGYQQPGGSQGGLRGDPELLEARPLTPRASHALSDGHHVARPQFEHRAILDLDVDRTLQHEERSSTSNSKKAG